MQRRGREVARVPGTQEAQRDAEGPVVIDEQLEFQIAQFADGTLPPAEAAALEQLLATDADARALLQDYRRIGAELKTAMPLPAIDWAKLADRLSDAVAAEDRATA